MALTIHTVPLLKPKTVVTVSSVEKKTRASHGFEFTPLFQETKAQVVQEIDETLDVLGLDRLTLSRRLMVQPSAVTQFLKANKGLQLTTLVRIADALGCDVEINFIRRGTA